MLHDAGELRASGWKLWLYTNYDCNLRCSYCLASSSPQAERRELGLANACRLVDEAIELGFGELFLTGGEPFLLDSIFDMLSYASARLPTTVLTNGLLLRGARRQRLLEVASPNLSLQVSLDGARPQHHDAYRGAGAWRGTVESIRQLLADGLRVRLSTTETPANAVYLDELCALHRGWGIPEEDHVRRPLARRGFSLEGLEVSIENLAPEITVSRDGVFWHPLSTDADMLVSAAIFPLRDAVEAIDARAAALGEGASQEVKKVT